MSTAFLDARTAGGVHADGRPIPAQVKRDATVVHYLRAAHAAGVERVYLTGPRPRLSAAERREGATSAAAWLFVPAPGWSPAGHYIDGHALDVARFVHDQAGARVELRRAAEWFGWGDYTPRTAADAWRQLGTVHARAFGTGAKLLASPAGTAQDGWTRTLPRDADVPQLSDELQELVRTTAVQHHVDFVHHTEPLPGFVYMDGRFMFAALTKELGVGPVTRDRVDSIGCGLGEACTHKPKCGYERARYKVTATVPRGWPYLGMLPVNVGDQAWEWPRQPGGRFTTWVDGAEAKLAREWGWELQVHERLLFTRGRPLDTWTDKLARARATVDAVPDDQADDNVRRMVKGALRAMLVQGIGAFHSTGRNMTRVAFDPFGEDVTAARRAGLAVRDVAAGVFVWQEPQPLTGRAALFRHPEWSAAVWGRSHARLLAHRDTGVLTVDPSRVIGVRGDAVYLTHDPDWFDDGANGRLRVKGRLPGPIPAPADMNALNVLRERAEKAGT
ncbi:MAG: hypothetical protein JWO67_32 [Streptosporangiaceae bacterium]|nr:hypothetical protein [Streptosporangiaceae bacterium]